MDKLNAGSLYLQVLESSVDFNWIIWVSKRTQRNVNKKETWTLKYLSFINPVLFLKLKKGVSFTRKLVPVVVNEKDPPVNNQNGFNSFSLAHTRP